MFRTSSPTVAGQSAWPILVAAALALGLVLMGPGAIGVQAQDDAADPLRTVSVSGVGHSEIEPDEAVIQLGVTARAVTAQGASRKAAAAMDAVIGSLQDSGVEEADIKTTRLELRQVRQRDRETREVTVRWQVQNRVRATIRDIDSTGDTIDAAIAAGATNLDRLQFRASDPSAALAEAREAAVASAALTASQLASAADVEVGSVLSIVDDSFRAALGVSSGRNFYAESGPRLASTPIQPGTLDIEVTVYIEYLIS